MKMNQKERINSLKNDIPELKNEIIDRSKNTVEGSNYVYVSEDLVVSIASTNEHYFKQPLIMFPSGPFGEKTFDSALKNAIYQESIYTEID